MSKKLTVAAAAPTPLIETLTATPRVPLAASVALPLAQLVEAKYNPRQYFDPAALNELAGDIAAHGVLQPLLVRPCLSGFHEVIFGSRRKRAAALAGLTEVPCIVYECGDEEALELAIVENAKRADISALEEAEAYRRLRDEHRMSVDEIAARVGKSKASVYARLKLCELGAAARAAFAAGTLDASTALLVARIPSETLQAKAVLDLTGQPGGLFEYEREPLSYREAARWVQARYMLRLEEADFDVADVNLLVPAGACTTCPRRTGNQGELFADVDSADVCTDPACYAAKVAAAFDRRAAQARERGVRVLTAAQSKKLYPHEHNQPCGSGDLDLVDLDEKTYAAGNRSYRAVVKAVGLKLEDLGLTLARDFHGRPRELLPREAAEGALRRLKRAEAKAGGGAGGGSGGNGGSSGTNGKGAGTGAGRRAEDPALVRERAEREIERTVVARLLERLCAAAGAREAGRTLWGWIAQQVIEIEASAEDVATRRGLMNDENGDRWNTAHDKLAALATEFPATSLRALVVELLATPAEYVPDPLADKVLLGACAACGLDAEGLIKEYTADVRAERKAAEKAAATGGAKGEAKGNGKSKAAGKPTGKAQRAPAPPTLDALLELSLADLRARYAAAYGAESASKNREWLAKKIVEWATAPTAEV